LYTITGKFTSALITEDSISEECIEQVQKICNQAIFKGLPIVLQADAHYGMSSPIGFTCPMSKLGVIPNLIGVDIGCGMLSTHLPTNLGIPLEVLARKIKEKVPMGFHIHKKDQIRMEIEFPWAEVKNQIQKSGHPVPDRVNYSWWVKRCQSMKINTKQVARAIGTLGGGNHFVEIGKSENTGEHWLTIHSGSRNFGLKVAKYHQKRAVKLLKEKRETVVKENLVEARKNGLDPKDLSEWLKDEYARIPEVQKGYEYLEKQAAAEYVYDMIVAQLYASISRKRMTKAILKIIDHNDAINQIESIHNYIDFDDLMIRKGAIRSYEDELSIIPFNMRDGTLICVGKSNPEFNYSAPHGAGRILSRRKAKATLTMEDFENQMAHICSSSVVPGTLDEAPGAYKDPELIEAAIEPTAKVVDRLKPVLNIKATS